MKADNISPQASGDSLREILLAFKTIIQLFYLHHKELCSLIAAIWALGSLLALPYLLRPIPVVRNIVPDDYYIVGFRDLKTLLTPPSFRGVIHFLWPFLPPWDEGLPARVSLLGALLGAMAVDHGLSLLVSTLRKWTIAENVLTALTSFIAIIMGVDSEDMTQHGRKMLYAGVFYWTASVHQCAA